jgi:hypothetical protein
MSKRLTAVGVRNAQPFPGRRREIPDPGCPSLYLIVQPSGRKSWAVRYRHAGKPQKLTIGSWPRVSLEHARRDATAALLQLRQGADPAAAKNHARAAADLQARDTVANLATQYFEKHVRVRLRPDPSRQWKANSGASSCRRGGGARFTRSSAATLSNWSRPLPPWERHSPAEAGPRKPCPCHNTEVLQLAGFARRNHRITMRRRHPAQ